MPEPPNPRRRWFRFSLRTLLIAMLVLSAAGGYAVISWRQTRAEWLEAQRLSRERKEALSALLREAKVMEFARPALHENPMPFLHSPTPAVTAKREVLGDRPRFSFRVSGQVKPATEKRFRAAFPEAEIYIGP